MHLIGRLLIFFFGDAANGIYAIAHKIPALCSAVFNMFSISWQQEVVNRIHDKGCKNYLNSIFNNMLVILNTFCSCLLAASWILYKYIFDTKYYEAYLYAPILIVSAIYMALSQYVGGIQIALKQPKKNGETTVLGAVVNVVLHLILISYINLFAAAVSTLIANVLIFFVRLIQVQGTFKINISIKSVISILALVYFVTAAYKIDSYLLNIGNMFASLILLLLLNKKIILTRFLSK